MRNDINTNPVRTTTLVAFLASALMLTPTSLAWAGSNAGSSLKDRHSKTSIGEEHAAAPSEALETKPHTPLQAFSNRMALTPLPGNVTCATHCRSSKAC